MDACKEKWLNSNVNPIAVKPLFLAGLQITVQNAVMTSKADRSKPETVVGHHIF